MGEHLAKGVAAAGLVSEANQKATEAAGPVVHAGGKIPFVPIWLRRRRRCPRGRILAGLKL